MRSGVESVQSQTNMHNALLNGPPLRSESITTEKPMLSFWHLIWLLWTANSQTKHAVVECYRCCSRVLRFDRIMPEIGGNDESHIGSVRNNQLLAAYNVGSVKVEHSEWECSVDSQQSLVRSFFHPRIYLFEGNLQRDLKSSLISFQECCGDHLLGLVSLFSTERHVWSEHFKEFSLAGSYNESPVCFRHGSNSEVMNETACGGSSPAGINTISAIVLTLHTSLKKIRPSKEPYLPVS